MPVTRCFWCGRVSAVCFPRFYLLSPVLFCSFFTPSAVYMPVARVPAVPPRASQPFPQFERAAGFTGFTLTPLTPRPRPPTATHPAAGQSRDAHVAITHRLARDWPRPATPLTLIGCVLPPARPLWISFLCFLFFFPVLSAEASLLAAAQRSDWSSSSCTRSCRRPFLHSSVRSFSSSTQPRCCQVSFQKLGMLELCGTARGSRTSGFGVRGRSGSAAPVGLFRLGSAGLCWRCLLVYLRSQWTQSLLCMRARVSSTNSCIPAVHRSPLQKLYRCFLCFGTVDAFGSVSSIN